MGDSIPGKGRAESQSVFHEVRNFLALTLGPNGEYIPTYQRLEKLALCHDINISLQKKFERHRPCTDEWYFPL